jgi:hypothetical protein
MHLVIECVCVSLLATKNSKRNREESEGVVTERIKEKKTIERFGD